MRCLAVLALFPLPALAQDLSPRAGDVLLSAAQMSELVIGQTHEFYDGGRSFFSISGTYTYTYVDGGTAYGEWDMPEAGQAGVVCTYFRHGFSRCDRYVLSSGRLLLITEDGTRFPVRGSSSD